jgi:hypothetical protein
LTGGLFIDVPRSYLINSRTSTALAGFLYRASRAAQRRLISLSSISSGVGSIEKPELVLACVMVPLCPENWLRFSACLDNKVTVVRFEWVASQTPCHKPEAT